jgi:hypothetical protein
VLGADRGRGLRGLVARLGLVRPSAGDRPAAALPPPPQDDEPVVTSKALQQFLSCLRTSPAPALLDVGPVVASNVTFFNEQSISRFYLESLLADFERHVRDGRVEEFPAYLSKRLTLKRETVDGVLAWDLYDYLDRPSALALASMLVRLLRPGGVLLGYFGSASDVGSEPTEFVIVDESHVRLRPHASTIRRQSCLQNRDIERMFDGLQIVESLLLRSGRREMLFRKE